MINLSPIKERLLEYEKSRDFINKTHYHNEVPVIQPMEDVKILLEEVERLRSAIKEHRNVYVAERTGDLEASWAALDEADRKLWEVLKEDEI